MTLIEVVVVLAIIGVIAGMTSLVVPRVLQPPADDPGRVLAESRRRALRDGAAQTTWLLIDSVVYGINTKTAAVEYSVP